MNGKFFCKKCEKDVKLEYGFCPECHTDWTSAVEKNMDEVVEKELSEEANKTVKKITKGDINQNIAFFLSFADKMAGVIIVLAIIVMIASLFLIEDTDYLSLLLIPVGIVMIFAGILINNSLKWKAYMLYTSSKNIKG